MSRTRYGKRAPMGSIFRLVKSAKELPKPGKSKRVEGGKIIAGTDSTGRVWYGFEPSK